MKVSVVLIVLNERKHIKRCVDALLRQSFLDYEIIVIDNGSIDGTGEIIESYDDVKIKYFVEFLFIVVLFFIFKLLGLKLASKFGSFIGGSLGPLVRSKKKIILKI